jgi:hypothetical protein
MDKLKIALTKMTMLMERQMNYLFHDRINGILPPFVNMGCTWFELWTSGVSVHCNLYNSRVPDIV